MRNAIVVAIGLVAAACDRIAPTPVQLAESGRGSERSVAPDAQFAESEPAA